MTNINSPVSILELGSTHVRVAIYDKELLNQNLFYEEKINYTKNDDFLNQNSIFDLIVESEKNIGQHLNEIILLIDSSSIFSLDFSIQKNFEKKIITRSDIDYLINECENIIKLNNKKKRRITRINF